MREQIQVRLKITSTTLTTAQLEAAIGLKPDESWKIGDRFGAFGVLEKAHGFVLEGNTSHMEPLERHVQAMIKRVAPYAQRIGALGDQVMVELGCIAAVKQVPRLSITRDELRWIAVMGARLDLDISVVSDQPKGMGAAKPDEKKDEKKPSGGF